MSYPDLKDKRVLITGASRGIGKAIVQSFLACGSCVAYSARTVKGDEYPDNANAVGTALDVSDLAALESWVTASATQFGGIDVVISTVSTLATENTLGSWTTTFNTDVLPQIKLIETSLPYLRQSAAPAIVIMSSASAVQVPGSELKWIGPGPYGPGKLGMLHYAKQLSYALGKYNIRVNSVSPGHIYSKEGGPWKTVEDTRPEVFKAALAEVPLCRMGTTEEVAKVCCWLASAEASYVTGVNIRIDGGMTPSLNI